MRGHVIRTSILLKRLYGYVRRSLIPDSDKKSDIEYWRSRAKQFGKRAVLNVSHPGTEFNIVTERQKSILFPILKSVLSGEEEIVLDFGSGEV